MAKNLPIQPTTKVAALLEHYPELEDVLIGMAPPFRKLKNPLLRRSVGKVASLKQAAAVGRLPVLDMVNRLRVAVGQAPLDPEPTPEQDPYFQSRPPWFDASRIVDSIDEGDVDPDVMPLKPLVRRAVALEQGEILELVTTYLPAPGIDIMRKRGFLVWACDEQGAVKTYISKS